MWSIFAKCDKSKIQKLWPRYEKKKCKYSEGKRNIRIKVVEEKKVK